MSQGPTEKQLRYLAVLAGQLGQRDEWDLFDMSRSSAQRRATLADATRAIEAAQAALAIKERRAVLAVGSWDDGDLKIADERWVAFKDPAAAAEIQALQAAGPVDFQALRADWRARRAAGSTSPVTDAIAAVVAARAAAEAARPAAEAARREAIRQIHALMSAHGITTSDL
jgi:multidrug efflux pump subunit AcrA (membrane-fusion protein)